MFGCFQQTFLNRLKAVTHSVMCILICLGDAAEDLQVNLQKGFTGSIHSDQKWFNLRLSGACMVFERSWEAQRAMAHFADPLVLREFRKVYKICNMVGACCMSCSFCELRCENYSKSWEKSGDIQIHDTKTVLIAMQTICLCPDKNYC